MSRLLLENIGKDFPGTKAVDNVTLSVEDGEMLTIVGPSGCGKTTILRMIAGLILPSFGKITLGDRLLADARRPSKAVLPEDRDIGMVFQSYAVWPHKNVYENVAYPLKLRKTPKEEVRRQVGEILRIVHLEGFEKRMTYQLSGGQQQRVALARALVMRPKLLLLDEPLSNLDAALREQMRGEIKEIQHSMGITIVNVTHDQIEAMTMSDKVAVMKSGKLIQYDTPYNLYEHPANSFVAKFIGSGNILPAIRTNRPPDENGMMEVILEGDFRVLTPYTESRSEKGAITVRAHHLIPGSDGIPARVLRRLYQGDVIEYLLETSGGSRVNMTCPTGFDYALGDTLKLDIEHAVWLDE